MWKQVILIAMLAIALGPRHTALAADPGDSGGAQKPHRVVMHLNSGEEKVQRGALNNIRHLYQEVGRERLQLELVAHGAGLSLLMKSTTTLGPELAQLKADYGVNYTACSNTMKAMKVTREDLIGEVGDTVPAMVRLMERQEQGWAYIKP
ncbi:DsrE family protein [Nitrospira sp. NS4]|uniref:DsrE family protein n=1 Tax=Nitrospira sp. NS4 TaxID=3414498 RepID=UPI003C301C5C